MTTTRWTRESINNAVVQAIAGVAAGPPTASAHLNVLEQVVDDLLAHRDNLDQDRAHLAERSDAARELLRAVIRADKPGPTSTNIVDVARWAADQIRGLRQHVCPAPLGPASSWRLPDSLGGHPVNILRENGPAVTVEICGPLHNGVELTLWRDQLIEVRPPSIDDPITLPLALSDEYHDGIVISGRLDDQTPAEVQRTQNGEDLSSPVYLTVQQCRDAARALWQRANAVESARDGAS